MSYQVLARKYRPKNFETLVGQEHVVRALTHALEHKRLHHAYLFTGTRGVGKTTLSRILAKSLNCTGPDGNGGITARPCGACDACVAIDAGRFVDYIEMDAASNRGVDEMAQLLEQAVYAPSNARFKVYMIDEVHMLTNHAFNAMLKTLEEPPEHVKFILATTDPQKIPVTVLSRCLQFNLKQMPPGHIVGHLEDILGQEGIGFESPALRLIAQGAHGSMRDALSLTDQAIAYAAGTVTLGAVRGMLGTLDQSYLVRLLETVAAGDVPGSIAVADEIAARSLSFVNALQDLGALLHAIALAQAAPSALAEDLPEREAVLRLAGLVDPQEVQLYYQIAVHGRRDIGLAPDEYAGFTMTLLRMHAFRPGADEAGDAEPAGKTEKGGNAGGGNAGISARPAPAPVSAPSQAAAPAPSAPSAPSAAAPRAATPTPPTSAAGDIPSRPAGTNPARAALDAARARTQARAPEPVRPVDAVPSPKPPAAPAATCAPPEPASEPVRIASEPTPYVSAGPAPQPVADLDWDGDWPALAAALPVRGVAQQLAQQSELEAAAGEGANLVFSLRVPLETLLSAGSADKLAAALTERFGRPVQLRTSVGRVADTAHARALARQAERQQEAERTIENDPFVQTLVREFGATIVPGSIRPV